MSSASASRRAPRRASAVPVALAVALAGCSSASSDGGTGPAAPSPSGAAAGACRALDGELPRRVDGQERHAPGTAPEYTAAWGDPAVELRCGVPRPEVLSPGSEHYNPTSDAAEVNGVSWLIEEREDGYRFTTTERSAYVEVTVPGAYAPEIGVLTELAAAVKTVPPRG